MEPFFEIKLDGVEKGSRASVHCLHEQLRAAILEGRLAKGARLPATRKSAAFFGVSRNTAVEIYERLVEEGFAVSRRGSGTFVAEALPSALPKTEKTSRRQPDPRLNAFWLNDEVTAAMSFWRDPLERQAATSSERSVDFRPALVDSRLFPHEVFRRVCSQRMRVLERKPASFKSPQGNQGNYALRGAIHKHVALTRAVACEPDDVLVTSGAQQAFDLLARTLVIPGETVVALEDPGYPPMRVAFAAAGAKLHPIGVDAEGMIVEQLPQNANIICVTPSHQFPLGVSMSTARRKALLAFAREHRAVVVEDDYDGEFRYDGSPLEALRTAEAADVVFYVGTFSKSMLPALRLGFVVAPDWALPTLVAAKNALDWHCPTLLQTVVAAFIAQGHLDHHVRKLRELYRRRRQLLLEIITDELGEWLDPIPSFYGIHVSAIARGSLGLDDLTEFLVPQNVKLHALSRYYFRSQPQEGLVFGYGAVDEAEIRRGLEALKFALRR